jgi:(p)ppGpp synthase/HD superfamily hydrolase
MDYAATLLAKLPGASRRDHGLRQLVETLESYLQVEEIETIMRAYEFGAAAHDGQKRQSGEDYISHPVAVARELADMHMDAQAIAAAILHDVVEDTEASLAEIEEQFGEEVAILVDGVSKLDQIQFRSRAEAQAESFRKMMLAMIEDIRVILVKLADRLHNMQTLDSMPARKKARIARETLDIYAPIANRLGINRFKVMLEDLGFRHLYPMRYRVLDKALRRSKGSQRQIKRLLQSARARARSLQADARPLQGLRRHSAHQWLSVTAHHLVRSQGPAARSADSNS